MCEILSLKSRPNVKTCYQNHTIQYISWPLPHLILASFSFPVSFSLYRTVNCARCFASIVSETLCELSHDILLTRYTPVLLDKTAGGTYIVHLDWEHCMRCFPRTIPQCSVSHFWRCENDNNYNLLVFLMMQNAMILMPTTDKEQTVINNWNRVSF